MPAAFRRRLTHEQAVRFVSLSQTSTPLRIGTRGSALAMWQATTVQRLLHERWPDHDFGLQVIKPEGDLDKHSSLTAIGGRGVFTSALQVQLLDNRIDLAVHSTKDLPSLAPHGVGIAAFPQREDPRDALVTRHNVPLEDLPANPVIGTSSRRRAVQLLAVRPDAQIRELRGNIDTRLRKGRSGEYDAVILASAGLHRMGWEHEITSLLPVEVSCPAPGQGALAIETRIAPDPAWSMIAALDDADIRREVSVERAFLRGVGGGCTTPIGAHAKVERMHGITTVRFWAMLASDDGSRLQRIYEEYPLDGAEDRAFDAAARLLHAVAPKWTGIGDASPLTGLRVVVTGSDAQATSLMQGLRDEGTVPHRMRTIEIEPVEDDSGLRVAVDDAIDGGTGWVVLTSPNAVPALADALGSRTLAASVAVVGNRTGEALREAGIEPDLVSAGPGAVQLVADLGEAGVDGSRVLCLLSDRARPTLVDGLQRAGADVHVATAYRNRPVDHLEDEMRELVRNGRVDVITFASPSAVMSFRTLVGIDLPAMSGAAFFAIGPTTAAALDDAGLPVHGQATSQDAAGFINALRAYFGHTSLTPEGESAS
jgi:hydroxymethylbilane synthase